MKVFKVFYGILAFILIFSCRKNDIIADEVADNLKLSQLGTEVETFAQNKACAGDDCRVMAMGAKACGGPTRFIVYSLSKTDEKTLAEKVKAYTDFQKELNTKYNRISDCAMILMPTVDCVNGLCTTK